MSAGTKFVTADEIIETLHERAAGWHARHGHAAIGGDPRDVREAAYGRIGYTIGFRDAYVAMLDLLQATRPDHRSCPARAKASIDAYCELGMPPGDFVRAVLSNDLYDAVTRPDDINLPALPHIVAYVVQRVPMAICGSRDAVHKHIAAKKETRDSAHADLAAAAADEVQKSLLGVQLTHTNGGASTAAGGQSPWVGQLLCHACGKPSHPGRFCNEAAQ